MCFITLQQGMNTILINDRPKRGHNLNLAIICVHVNMMLFLFYLGPRPDTMSCVYDFLETYAYLFNGDAKFQRL